MNTSKCKNIIPKELNIFPFQNFLERICWHRIFVKCTKSGQNFFLFWGGKECGGISNRGRYIMVLKSTRLICLLRNKSLLISLLCTGVILFASAYCIFCQESCLMISVHGQLSGPRLAAALPATPQLPQTSCYSGAAQREGITSHGTK